MSEHPEPTVAQLFDLTGRVALLTGGAGHLGSAIGRALAEAGATVIVTSRNPRRAEQAAAELSASGTRRHWGLALDQMLPASLEASFAEAISCCGQIDILINNGHEASAADWSAVTAEEFSRHLANATGYFLLSRMLRDHLVSRGAGGSIVMLGSMYGVVASYPDAYEGICAASPVAYHTLKGGIVHLTRHLAAYWARDRIRVNCLSPGPFPSDRAPAGLAERLQQKLPMGRMGQPWELKGAVVFLASNASSFVTGQNLLVDGGWTAW